MTSIQTGQPAPGPVIKGIEIAVSEFTEVPLVNAVDLQPQLPKPLDTDTGLKALAVGSFIIVTGISVGVMLVVIEVIKQMC